MTHVAFDCDGWEIVGHNYEFNLDKPYYLEHKRCPEPNGSWTRPPAVICHGCNEPVPESIQGVITLLMWGHND